MKYTAKLAMNGAGFSAATRISTATYAPKNTSFAANPVIITEVSAAGRRRYVRSAITHVTAAEASGPAIPHNSSARTRASTNAAAVRHDATLAATIHTTSLIAARRSSPARRT